MSIFDTIADAAKKIAGVAPWIGTALGGPLVGSAVGFVTKTLGLGDPDEASKPENIPDSVKKIAELVQGGNPELIAKIKAADQEYMLKAQEMGYKNLEALNALAVQAAGQVNATMQVEAKSEHWPQYSWRPAVGFAVALTILLTALTVVGAYASVMFSHEPNNKILEYIPGMLTSISVVLATASPILGITAWFRGKEKVETVKAA